MAVTLKDFEDGNYVVFPSVPWSHKKFTIRKQIYRRKQPIAHLTKYYFKKDDIPRACSDATTVLKGKATRIPQMNQCVSNKIKESKT